MQRGRRFAALVSAAKRLAVDRHDAAELDPVRFGKRCHELSKHLLERGRIQQPEHAAEGVVAGNAVLQLKDAPKQLLFRLSEQRHLAAALRSTQNRRQRNEQNLPQLVPHVGGARIGQLAESLLEFAHRRPPKLRESSSESIFRTNAIPRQNPYAIPLPRRGRD
jgi:hypothetical protein